MNLKCVSTERFTNLNNQFAINYKLYNINIIFIIYKLCCTKFNIDSEKCVVCMGGYP